MSTLTIMLQGLLRAKAGTFAPAEEHFSIRDVYTASNGDLVLRFEGQDKRARLRITQDELPVLKQGIADNIRMRPENHYPIENES